MIVDSSVVLALLFGESRADEAAHLLNENRDRLHQSSVNAAEILMRLRYPRLNFGDCFTYAAARITGMPILTFDADFAGVDVEVVGL